MELSKMKTVAEFANSTSLHGLKYACDMQSHIIKRFIWIVLVLSMLTGYITIAIISTVKYYKFNSSTKISVASTSSLQFPAVSICNMNKISKSAVQNKPELEHWIRYMEHRPIADYNLTEEELQNARAVLKQESIMELFYDAPNRFLLSCLFDSQWFDCMELFEKQMSEAGLCYTFMAKDTQNRVGAKMTTRPGHTFGLRVWLDINITDYFLGAAYGAGVKVIVHEPDVYPRTDEKASAVPPGADAYLSVQKHVMKSLQPPYADVECIEADETDSFEGFSYSYESCMTNCLSEYLSNACNCSFEDSNSPCTIDDLYFCMKSVSTIFIDKCSCLYPCKHTFYETDLSFLQLPNPLLFDTFVSYGLRYTTIQEFRENMIHLNIFYSALQYTKTEQTKAYTLDELIANLGGQLGLFLGASLLTMAECLDYAAHFFTKLCKKSAE